MEFLSIEATLTHAFRSISLVLESICVLMIVIGAFEAAYCSLWPLITFSYKSGMRRIAWNNFARWLLLGLEFMLAADIVSTAISPNREELIRLAAIAIIRTFLGYFLERDLESMRKEQKTPSYQFEETS